MSPTLLKYSALALRVFLTLAFAAAGLAKLTGQEMMVGTFDLIGWGQWFRYVTGALEVVCAVLLWVPAYRIVGAGLLVCTMICAVLFHLFVLGPSLVPALVLGLLLVVLIAYDRKRDA